MPETNRIEYKQQLTDDLEKEAIAFLNYQEGGIMYIGIDKTGKAVGVFDIDSDMLKIKDRLRHNIMPSCMGLFDVCAEKQEGKDIIKIIFASGTEKPYYLKKYGMSEKGCFMRVGTAAEPMSNKIIEDLFARRTRNSIGRIKAPRQDLSFEQLKIYYETKSRTLNQQFAANLELLTEDGKYNYVAYLLSDVNVVSIKIAKYAGTNRYDLIENYEFGNCSLIKATKSVLDRLEVENRTFTKITHKERLERQVWNAVALREAVINAVVHNDYSYEAFPKFEIFDDRIEITSYGGLPQGINEDNFFEGASIPRNKELMRIFRDLEMVEYLGSGIPRILQAYGHECFILKDSYIRMIFPVEKGYFEQLAKQVDQENQTIGQVNTQVNTQVDTQVDTQVNTQVNTQIENLLLCLDLNGKTTTEIATLLKLKDRIGVMRNYIQPALKLGLIEMTIPDKPNSRLQKYRLTILGKQLKEHLTS